MKTLRRGSAAIGAAYLGVSASLVVHPPGHVLKIVTTTRTITLPAHETQFQQIVGGTGTWVGLLTLGGLALILVAWRWPGRLGFIHGALMSIMTALGFGYFVATLFVDTGWAAGALVLALAAAHYIALGYTPREKRRSTP